MYRWISWRNKAVLGLIMILLFLFTQTAIALTTLPISPTQAPVLTKIEQRPTQNTQPEETNDVVISEADSPNPTTPLVVSGAPAGWFTSRDCSTDLKIMPLGNSITAGKGSGIPPNQNMNDYLTGYRYPLDQLLNADNYNFDFVGANSAGGSSIYTFDTDHQGLSGQRLDELMGLVNGYLTANPPDLILLHIGTNDIAQDDTGEHTADLNTLLNNIDSFSTDIPIIIARIINEEEGWPQSTHAAYFTTYNSNLQTLANNRIGSGDLLYVVDMEPILDYTFESDDFIGSLHRLHPNATGYGKMATVWFDALKTVWPTCVPDITSTAPTTAVVNQLYTYDVAATADPTATYTLSGTIPTGMSIITETGVINWTPTAGQKGAANVEVVATNIAGQDSQQFVIQVVEAPSIMSAAPTTAVFDAPYTYQLVASGDAPVTFSFTTTTHTPPTGMSMNGTGLISWTPTSGQIGPYTIEVQAENAYGVDTQQFTITVHEAPSISSTAQTTATVDATYTYQLVASGDTPITFSLKTTTFTPPTGMSMNGTGLISWTPTSGQTGPHTIEVQAENVYGVDTQQFTVQVYQIPAISSSPMTTVVQGNTYIYNVVANGSPNLTFELTQFPTGMTIDENTGAIRWNVPADYTLGNVNVTVKVSNPVGMDQQSFTINVQQGYFINLPIIIK